MEDTVQLHIELDTAFVPTRFIRAIRKRLELVCFAFILSTFLASHFASAEPSSMRSPDGQRLASIDKRPSDGWDTILLREGGQIRDLLPKDKLPSPGARSLALGTWLDNHVLAFQFHCGTGCVGLYKINTATGTLGEIWTGDVDFGIYWSRTGDRVIARTRLGGLVMIYTDGPHFEVPGCRYSGGDYQGSWYTFEGWIPGGAKVRIRKAGCESFASQSSVTGENVLWDGQHFFR
jgi:hypothetical protein